MSQKRVSAVKIFHFKLTPENFGQTETEFTGPEYFQMKFGPKFSKTEKPKTETEFFGLTECPPLPLNTQEMGKPQVGGRRAAGGSVIA